VKRLAAIIAIGLIGALATPAQTTNLDFWQFPDKVVEKYWEMGVRGELLSSAGWKAASSYFTKPNPDPKDKSFDVYSNFYGITGISSEAGQADVQMEFIDGGRIDSNLRYSPPTKTAAFKTAFDFHLVQAPAYMRMFGPDGKTEVEKKQIGYAWKIDAMESRPWTTVNTAIRYVLEMRNKTTDPAIKKNADDTLAKLLTLH